MKDGKPAPSSTPIESRPSDRPANLSPGMATLLRGNQSDPRTGTEPEPKPAEEPKQPPGHRYGLFRLSLILADLLLVALAACLAWRKGSFGFFEIALCILALALGAWLTCLALWFGKDAS